MHSTSSYLKKLNNKIQITCSKKKFFFSVTPEKFEAENEEGIENDCEKNGKLEDCDNRKTIKVKPFGGPLLAQS